jgi:hypothetical protein
MVGLSDCGESSRRRFAPNALRSFRTTHNNTVVKACSVQSRVVHLSFTVVDGEVAFSSAFVPLLPGPCRHCLRASGCDTCQVKTKAYRETKQDEADGFASASRSARSEDILLLGSAGSASSRCHVTQQLNPLLMPRFSLLHTNTQALHSPPLVLDTHASAAEREALALTTRERRRLTRRRPPHRRQDRSTTKAAQKC